MIYVRIFFGFGECCMCYMVHEVCGRILVEAIAVFLHPLGPEATNTGPGSDLGSGGGARGLTMRVHFKHTFSAMIAPACATEPNSLP